MKYAASLICLWFLLANSVMAGTLTLLSGEELTFDTEKEFVAILLEEFLPLDFDGNVGFFLVSDSSEEKTWLRKLLVHAEELELFEGNPTAIYPSLDELLQSEEYTEMGRYAGYENVFAVEVALKDLDMVYVYQLPSPMETRSRNAVQEPGIIIDATGESGFEMLEE
jgi:hypothetical protein